MTVRATHRPAAGRSVNDHTAMRCASGANFDVEGGTAPWATEHVHATRKTYWMIPIMYPNQAKNAPAERKPEGHRVTELTDEEDAPPSERPCRSR